MKWTDAVVSLPSKFVVKETMDKLEDALRSKGITVYGRINQQAEAKKAGLEIKALELLLFGNPGAGIPLIMQEPLSALDLPLKVLVWEGEEGQVWLSYTPFSYLQNRWSLPQELIDKISGVETLFKKVLEIS
jgi:uncharacterized protein (DUF302 family)